MSFTGNIRKTPFSILIAIQREMHQSEKAQRKNHVQAMYKKDTPKFPPLSLPFGYMLWTQTEESNSVFQTLPIIIIVRFMNDLWLNHQANILGTIQKYPFELICRGNEIKRCKCNQNIQYISMKNIFVVR